jgi:hypothetical protein
VILHYLVDFLGDLLGALGVLLLEVVHPSRLGFSAW